MAIFLESPRLILRPLEPGDANPHYQRWMNDREATRYLEGRFFPHSLESLRAFIASKGGDRQNVFLAITVKESARSGAGEPRHIGNIKLGPIDWVHRLGDIGILIGEPDCRGLGYGVEALGLLRDYAFDTLNLHKLTAGMYELNGSSRRIFEKVGFVAEGVRKSHYFCEGKWVDAILMGMINPRELERGSESAS